MSAMPQTRRETIERFLQQWAAVAFAVWLAIGFNRRGALIPLPISEALILAAGWLVSAVLFALILTATAWGFRAVLGWVLRNG